MQAIHGATLTKEDVLVAVSFSGSTKEILDATQRVKKNGVSVVFLTNYIKSPLTEMAVFVINTNIWEEALEAEIGSRLPFYFLVEALCKTIYANFPERACYISITADSISEKQIWTGDWLLESP